jgi:DNA polymerase
MDDHAALLAALRLQLDWGVDEALEAAPLGLHAPQAMLSPAIVAAGPATPRLVQTAQPRPVPPAGSL